MTDLISRADAIRALSGACSTWEDDAKVQEIIMVLPSAEAVQGFRGGKIPPKEVLDGTVLIPQHQWLEMERKLAEYAEAVQVVRCKDCKHYEFADNRAFGMPVKYCDWFGFEDVDDNDFCSRGERKGGDTE